MAITADLVKFNKLNPNNTFFESLRRDHVANTYSVSFDEWFYSQQKRLSSTIVTYDNNTLSGFMPVSVVNDKVFLEGSYLKAALRFQLKYVKFTQPEVFLTYLHAFCVCAMMLKNDFSQTYLVIPEQYVERIYYLGKRFNFHNLGSTESNERILLRNNKDSIKHHCQQDDDYFSVVLPLMRSAINDALCGFYANQPMNKVTVSLGSM